MKSDMIKFRIEREKIGRGKECKKINGKKFVKKKHISNKLGC